MHDSSSNVYQFDGLMRELTSTNDNGQQQPQPQHTIVGTTTNELVDNHMNSQNGLGGMVMSNSNATPTATSTGYMDWNNELIALYQELDQDDSLMAATMIQQPSVGGGAGGVIVRNSKQLTPSALMDDSSNRMSFSFIPNSSTTTTTTIENGINNTNGMGGYAHHQHQYGQQMENIHHGLIENGQNGQQSVVDANLWELLEPDYNQLN